ncbi:hypothetical protein TRFO_16205 [Tritrichomonas foetus]|uniref:Uncharacterized protein n=1 Tax=Tritrichomonas foetus TaxID=1144522 RepID=A0A1J4KQW0_9EUKA|nr:hypothetical protein TRFO_16205 [Tritrichomonas foetus]|eukprot:OHT13643.1 hypothetical protein TRFO_16205 [Tritrichomonas foetus]
MEDPRSALPFPFKYQKTERLCQSESIDLWRIFPENTNIEANLLLVYRNLEKKNFFEKVSKLTHLDYVSILPICSYDIISYADNKIGENELSFPAIYYKDTTNLIPLSKFFTNKRIKPTSLQRYKIILGITSAVFYLFKERVPINTLTVDEVLVNSINGETKIFNFKNFSKDYICETDYLNYLNFLASVIQFVVISTDNENDDEFDENNLSLPEFNFYNDFYNIIQNHANLVEKVIRDKSKKSKYSIDDKKPLKFNDLTFHQIWKSLINANLQTLGISEDDVDAARKYQSKLLTLSMKSHAFLEHNQKLYEQQNNLNDISENITFLKNEISKLRGILNNIQEKEEENKKILDSFDDFQNITKEKVNSAINSLEITSKNAKNVILPPSVSGGGICQYLIGSQTTKFDHLVIPSQSSGDVYCIIDENDGGNYSSGAGDYEWIQFEFQEEIEVTSFKIQSAHRAFLKTWGIVAYNEDGKEITLYETKNDNSLKGKNAEFSTAVLEKVKTNKIRLEKFGVNWSDTNFMRVKNIEFYTDDPKYQNGVFKQLLQEADDHDPHKAAVYLTASNFDFRYFHQINPKRSLCTLYDEKLPYFQIEFPKGKVKISGYRIQQLIKYPVLSWSLTGSNDKKHWKTLHNGETKVEEISQVMIYGVDNENGETFRFFRISNTMPNEDDNLKLRIRHFDVFGEYINC